MGVTKTHGETDMTVSFDCNSTQAQFHQYSFLVDRIVQKIASKYPHHSDTEEMMQFGYIGLIEAIDAFPIDKGISFARYASIRIQGRIVGK